MKIINTSFYNFDDIFHKAIIFFKLQCAESRNQLMEGQSGHSSIACTEVIKHYRYAVTVSNSNMQLIV